MIPTNKPLVLMILDGWGYSTATENNAIAQANTPSWDSLWADNLHCLIETSGQAVGLPVGQMGNSEVGHMNIGAGRIVYQDLTRISKAIEDGTCEEYLEKVSVNVGECHFLPSGLCHAIGAGIIIAEIQQPSDTTYRVFDWNRVDDSGNPRQLHCQ